MPQIEPYLNPMAHKNLDFEARLISSLYLIFAVSLWRLARSSKILSMYFSPFQRRMIRLNIFRSSELSLMASAKSPGFQSESINE